jgi:hypothetical protein
VQGLPQGVYVGQTTIQHAQAAKYHADLAGFNLAYMSMMMLSVFSSIA